MLLWLRKCSSSFTRQYWIWKRDDFNNLHVIRISPIKFQLNLTYNSRGNVILKNFKMPTKVAILDIRTEQFSYSESPGCPDAFHQVLAQWPYSSGADVVWRVSRWPIQLSVRKRCGLKIYGSQIGYLKGTTSAILNLLFAPMPSTKFWLNLTYGLRADNNSRFSRLPS